MPAQRRRRVAPVKRAVARRRKPWEGTVINAGGGSRAWSAIVAKVISEEPWCRLRLPGCTRVSTTADHIKPKSKFPRLADKRWNLRGSCTWCNQKRGDRPLEEVRAEMLRRGIGRPVRRARALEFFNTERENP